jgi:AcrR family transcriptional regulator
MARNSKRVDIVDAVVAIVERDGLTAVTLDAVASETGLSRPGLLYHYPSREALLHATHQHLIDSWEAGLVATAGKSWEEATPAERSAAYVVMCAQSTRRAELLLMLESVDDPELATAWRDLIERWAPPPPRGDDPRDLDAFIARLAADGLWLQATLPGQLDSALNAKVTKRLIEMSR